jgi:uncharacterized protein YjbJ (UPF0337 family)
LQRLACGTRFAKWRFPIEECHERESIFSICKENLMNWDVIEGNWKQVKGKVKQQWGKLTNDQLDMVSGRRDQLIGKIQESYGIARDEAERQVVDWEAQYGDILDKSSRRTGKSADTAAH